MRWEVYNSLMNAEHPLFHWICILYLSDSLPFIVPSFKQCSETCFIAVQTNRSRTESALIRHLSLWVNTLPPAWVLITWLRKAGRLGEESWICFLQQEEASGCIQSSSLTQDTDIKRILVSESDRPIELELLILLSAFSPPPPHRWPPLSCWACVVTAYYILMHPLPSFLTPWNWFFSLYIFFYCEPLLV